MTPDIQPVLIPRPARNDALDEDPRFQELLERGHDAALVIGALGEVRFANKAACELLERPAEFLQGLHLGLPLSGPGSIEIDLALAPGRARIAELRVFDSAWAGRPARVVLLRDVTRHAQTEALLRASEERYALAARAAHDGLWDWDLARDDVSYSPRWKAMIGCDEDKVGNTPHEWFGRVHPEDLDRVRSALSAHLEGLTSHFENEHRLLHENGSWRWFSCRGLAIRDANGKATRLAGSLSDVTHRKLAEEQLAHRAFYDPLTNLPNRALFLDRLRSALRRAARRHDYLFAVLFLDLDRFKLINDSLGHMAGDRLLVMIARRLELSLRPGDSVARLGGDEFTVLLDDIKDTADATRVAERIHHELMSPFNLGGQELFTSASIGIALSATGYEKPEDILRDADTAMYRAKALGRAGHVLFDTAMHAHAVALLRTEADLQRAIERGELFVEYQPIVALASGRITGVEALARWRHPERGLVSPAEFIPVAEETGLIVPIGRWVLLEACRQLRSWREKLGAVPECLLSVNLSGKQLSMPDLAQQIAQILAETGLDARHLQLEITESAIMEHPGAAAAMLVRLKELGIKLSIDDFGTGYSSLSYLQRFPVDSLKIDRSFIHDLQIGGENSEIARTIVMIGQNLGMGVIAEGVETADQLAVLRELECDAAQGYYFARALCGDDARNLFAIARRW